MTFNGEFTQARPIAQECLVLYQSLGNAGGEALVRCFALSGIAFGLGDYAEAEALTTYGIIGIKVWVFKGEILGHDPMSQDRLMMEAQTSGVRPAR